MVINDIAVVTSFFNFSRFLAPQRNLRRWHRYMEAHGVPTFGIEVILPDQEPVSEGWDGWRRLTARPGRNVMWQKEPAINACVRSLNPQYTKIVVCDADIFFDNPEWLTQTSSVLNVVNACQPFARACWTDKVGKVELMRASMGADPGGLFPVWRAHPGFAIALTRDFWNKDGPNGIYPYYIVGSGDTALGAALCGIDPRTSNAKMFSVGKMRGHYAEWYDRVRKWNTGLSHVGGTVYHEYHGSHAKRQYYERLAHLDQFDPETHLRYNSDGLLEWTDCASIGMVEQAANYFASREEDN